MLVPLVVPSVRLDGTEAAGAVDAEGKVGRRGMDMVAVVAVRVRVVQVEIKIEVKVVVEEGAEEVAVEEEMKERPRNVNHLLIISPFSPSLLAVFPVETLNRDSQAHTFLFTRINDLHAFKNGFIEFISFLSVGVKCVSVFQYGIRFFLKRIEMQRFAMC